MRPTRILVADPLPVFRSGVRALLARETDFEVIEASELDGVVQIVEAGCPDVALIDLDLPPHGGVEAVARLSLRCSSHTIVWSFSPDPETVFEAVRAGASGYLDKTISLTGLVRSLRGIMRGEAPLPRHLTFQLIEALHLARERESARERAAVLSAREREVLALVAGGLRNRQIAEALVISEFTVKRHMQNILQKLSLPSRRAAAAFHRSAFGEIAAGMARAAV
jgi:two-component system nitrate/nitrite response regulator NarL